MATEIHVEPTTVYGIGGGGARLVRADDREVETLRGLVARYQRKAAAANTRADRLAQEVAELQRKNQVLRSARSTALYQLQRAVRDLEVFDDRFMGIVETGVGTTRNEPPSQEDR